MKEVMRDLNIAVSLKMNESHSFFEMPASAHRFTPADNVCSPSGCEMRGSGTSDKSTDCVTVGVRTLSPAIITELVNQALRAINGGLAHSIIRRSPKSTALNISLNLLPPHERPFF